MKLKWRKWLSVSLAICMFLLTPLQVWAADGTLGQSETGQKVVSVSLDGDHSAAIAENGDLYCWGSNYYGEGGNGTTGAQYTPQKVLEKVKSVSLGYEYSAAITENGDLYCWGWNEEGQVGNGTTKDQNTPQKVLEKVKSASLGWIHSAAITENGDLYCWGNNACGQVGNGTTENQYMPQKVLEKVKSVSLGDEHSAAIAENGDLYCWGSNYYGEVGNGMIHDQLTPQKILEKVKSVSLRYSKSAAITEKGDLYCWGSNYYGEVGNGTTENQYTPQKVLEKVKSASLGWQHSAAITEDGDLYCWGQNGAGEVGNGTTTNQLTPTKISFNTSSTGSDHPSQKDARNRVCYIDTVDSKQVILDSIAYSVDESKVSLESLQSLVGKYAYVEFDNSIYHKVISVKEVKSSVGTITQYVEQNSSGIIDSIEIDHKAYEVNNKNIAIIDGRNKRVLYHTIDNQIVGLEVLKTEIGYFNGVSEDAKTVKISNEEYSFHEDAFISQNIENGKLVVFSVGTKNDDKENPFLVEMQELQGTPSVWVYVSDDTFSVELGEELDIYCALHIGDYVIPNWKKPSFAIGNDKLITVSNDKQTDLGYHCKVKGVALGQTTLTITDTDTGAHQSFPITVKNKKEMMSYTCRINEVPDFTIESGWDKGLQTNIYNVNGLYVNKYTYKKNNTDGYDVSFNVYNSLNMYGSVDVYDKDGKWIQSVKINKVTGITSLYKTGESLVYLLDDAIHKKSLTYEATTYTKKTGVEISVPKDGYFVISTNYADSPGVMLYNGVDMIMLGLSAVDSAYGKVDYSANLEKYLSNAKEKMLHEALQEAIKSKTKKFVSDQVKEAMTVGYSEAANAIATQTSELLTAEKADKDLCENVCGVGAEVLENYMGPAGAALKLLFGIQKYSDYMLQVVQLCKEISKSEIVISSVAEPSVYGITVKPENPQAVGEATLQVFRVSDKDEITSSFEKKTQTQSDKYEIYNICFVKDNVEQEINADVTVRIPIPKSFDANKSAIFRQEKDGSWTKLDSKIDGDYLEFKTNHFSLYAIAEGKTLNNATNLITSITLNMKNGTVDKNGSLKLEATVTPADATNKSLLWSSDNSSVATVDQNGLVTAVSAGKATITVKAQDGSRVEASCIVEVTGTSTGGNDSTGGGSSTGGGGSTSNGSDSTGGNSSTGGDSSNSGNNTTTPGNDSYSTTTEPNIKVLYYIVNFDQNGGTNLSRQKMTLLQDQPLGILPKVVRKNYTFAGWYTQPDGGEKVNSETVLGVSTSLFAHWKKVAKPSKGQISSLKSKKAGTMTVACKKQSGVKGYEIVYSTKKSFKKSATRKGTFASSHATVKGLKKGQTYYVKIHAYRIDSTGAKVYGKYSTTKKVKIKK